MQEEEVQVSFSARLRPVTDFWHNSLTMRVCVDRNDDWGAQYSFVPRNTLLEPNNVIPSWEFGDEENKEVSATLRRIRQKYDDIHKTVLAKEKELEIKKVRETTDDRW